MPRNDARSPDAAAVAVPSVSDLQAVNERLLLSSLREQELADRLRHQLAFTSAITASLGEGLYAVDKDGRITFVNPIAEQLLGWPATELLNQDAHALVHGACSTDSCPLREVLRTGITYRNEDDLFTRKDGTLLPTAYSSAAITTASEVTGAVIAFRDMTERKRAAEELAARTEAVTALAAERASILAQLSDGVVLADPSGRITFVNDAARRLLGESGLGLQVEQFAAACRLVTLDGEASSLEELALLRATRHGERVDHVRRRIRRPDGTEVIAEGSAAPIFTDNGRQLGAVLVLRDLTAEVQVQQQKDDFFVAIAHDLQSPLTAAKGMAQLLRRHVQRHAPPDPTRLDSGLEQIEDIATHMSTLVQELADLTRLTSSQSVELRRQPTDMLALSRRVAAELERPGGEHRIQVGGDGTSVIGQWDVARLKRLLTNLFANALKYSPQGGEIAVIVALDGERAVLTVQDHGVGIPVADLPHVFERFHRGSNVAGRIVGTGIGLASARQVVEEHGGTITIDSQEEVGTTVTVRLPLK